MAANFEDVLGFSDDELDMLTKEEKWVVEAKKQIYANTMLNFRQHVLALSPLIHTVIDGDVKLLQEAVKIIEAQARKLDKQSKWLDQ